MLLIEREIRNVYFVNGFDFGWCVLLIRIIVVDYNFGVEFVYFIVVILNVIWKEK